MEAHDDPYAPTAPGSRPLEEPPATSRDPGLVGRRLGVYEILEEVGRGGMGVVYRARDKSLDRDVALKVLQPSLSKDPEFERRFVREARTAAKLDHPNIVQVYTAGRNDDVLFIAMQFIRGRTLHQLIREKGRLGATESLGIVRQVAEALEAAHSADLVHRDIKPNNIMIDESGRVKIMDFGLMRSSLSPEKITQAGEFFGTPEYASPEQCETAVLDGRSDIYSLGAVLYEMLAGKMPYTAETPLALFDKIRKEEPPPLRSLNADVKPEVEALVQKMMAKKPCDRFASAGQLAEFIRAVEKGARLSSMLPKSARRGRLGWIAAAAVLVLAVAGWGFFRPGPVAPPTPVVAAEAERMKLVVFDLKQGIPNAETAWYEIALSDMLIASLAQQPFLEVPTRDQLLWKLKEMRLAGPVTDETKKVLTHELGAHAYLSGTYYVQGGKIRVTLSGYRLPQNSLLVATKTFDKPEQDLFALVDDAAKAVAADLRAPAGEVLARVAAAPDVKPCSELALAYRDRSRSSQHDEAGREDLRSLKEMAKNDAPVVLSAAPAAAPPAPRSRADGAEKAGSVDKKKSVPTQDPKPGGGALQQAERRKASFGAALGDRELLQAWYQNRQALEQCKLDPEEFEALAQGLKSQFKVGEDDAAAWKQGVQNFAEGLQKATEARQGGWKWSKDILEFLCPGCKAVSKELGRCAKCDMMMVLRLKVPEKAKKE